MLALLHQTILHLIYLFLFIYFEVHLYKVVIYFLLPVNNLFIGICMLEKKRSIYMASNNLINATIQTMGPALSFVFS